MCVCAVAIYVCMCVMCFLFYIVTAVSKRLATYAIKANPMRAIRPLRAALTMLQRDKPHLLTPIHCDYVRICLKAKCYKVALAVLSDIFEINPSYNRLTPQQYLEYFYYLGMIYCGVKQFDDAQEMFQMVFLLFLFLKLTQTYTHTHTHTQTLIILLFITYNTHTHTHYHYKHNLFFYCCVCC